MPAEIKKDVAVIVGGDNGSEEGPISRDVVKNYFWSIKEVEAFRALFLTNVVFVEIKMDLAPNLYNFHSIVG